MAGTADADPCPLCAAEQQPPHVVLHADVEPEPGHWCPHCALPAAVWFPLTTRCVHGWPLGLTMPPVERCEDCGRFLGAVRPSK